jgi:hypothetical protein
MASENNMGNNAKDRMDDNEVEEPREDLEVEITDLDEVKAGGGSPRSLPLFPEDGLISRKYRRQRMIATTALIVLAMLILLFNTTSIGQVLTLASLTNKQMTFLLRVDANPPWGRLYVDGTSVRLIPDGAYSMLSITAGQHRLTWHADPFSAQECVISMPVGSGPDTCKHPDFVPESQASLRTYILFLANLSLLSPVQRTALMSAVQVALASKQSGETVQAGELYALASQGPESNRRSCSSVYLISLVELCFATAHSPLEAKLSMQLDTSLSHNDACSSGACEVNGQDCRLFCDVPGLSGLSSDASGSVWQAFALVHVYWQFATRNGQVIAANEPDTFLVGIPNEHLLELNIGWKGKQWSVTITSPRGFVGNNNPVCDAASGDLYALAFGSTPPFSESELVPGPTTASGCLLKISLQLGPNAGRTPTAESLSVAYVLQRFGVLLAVNTTAHHLWSFLPVADAYAQKLAQQWIAPGNIGQ